MKKLKDILKESNVQIGKVYSNPYATAFVKENEEEKEPQMELSEEQKKAFLEAVKQYKKYGEAVYRNAGLGEVYESIKNMVEMAGKVTLSETDDWFDNVTVSRHMKRMGESFKVFEKTLKEVSTLQQRLEASYDEIGEVLGKYYEISEELDPVGKEDDDIDNDGDSDESDKYLANRRKVISKAIKKESMKLTDMIPVNEDIKSIDNSELKRFIDYMNDFYGKRGVYSSGKDLKPNEVIKALNQVFKKNKKYEWGGGDSVDREFTRDELMKMGVLSDEIYKKESVNDGNMKESKPPKGVNLSIVDKEIKRRGKANMLKHFKDIKKNKLYTKVNTPKSIDYLINYVSNFNESVNEASLELKKLEDAIKMFQDKIKKQGRVTNARDEEHLENLIKVYKQMGGKNIKESVNEGKYDIGMARKGNGITVYNRAEEEKGDYKNIAHISDNGTVKYYDKKLPNDIKKKIEAEASKMKESVKESMKLSDMIPLNEGTRSQVGYIDTNGNIKSAYVHFDGYPENMKPGIKKHMKSEKDVKTLIKRGGARGIFDDKPIEYYDDKSVKPMSGNLEDIETYIKDSDFKGGAEFVYLYNTKDKKWYFADTYKDKELKKLY